MVATATGTLTMLPLLFLASAFLTTPEEEQRALEAASKQNLRIHAEKCVATQALRYTRYTSESIAEVAEQAAFACAKKISAADQGNALTFRGILVARYRHEAMNWRARAAERGEAEYDAIKAEIDSLFCEVSCGTPADDD